MSHLKSGAIFGLFIVTLLCIVMVSYIQSLRNQIEGLRYGILNVASFKTISETKLTKRLNPLYTRIDTVQLDNVPEKLIGFAEAADIEKRRKEAYDLIWASAVSFSEKRLPAVVESNVQEYPFP